MLHTNYLSISTKSDRRYSWNYSYLIRMSSILGEYGDLFWLTTGQSNTLLTGNRVIGPIHTTVANSKIANFLLQIGSHQPWLLQNRKYFCYFCCSTFRIRLRFAVTSGRRSKMQNSTAISWHPSFWTLCHADSSIKDGLPHVSVCYIAVQILAVWTKAKNLKESTTSVQAES